MSETWELHFANSPTSRYQHLSPSSSGPEHSAADLPAAHPVTSSAPGAPGPEGRLDLNSSSAHCAALCCTRPAARWFSVRDVNMLSGNFASWSCEGLGPVHAHKHPQPLSQHQTCLCQKLHILVQRKNCSCNAVSSKGSQKYWRSHIRDTPFQVMQGHLSRLLIHCKT